MGIVDLGSLKGDQIVIHYGGALKSVDAYTFANSLIAFADTVRAVSEALDSDPFEIRIEALGHGSFRAIVKKTPKELGGFLLRGVETLFWAYVAFLILEKTQQPTGDQITINTDEVIIQRGDDRIIVPRGVYENGKKLSRDPAIQEHIARTFEIIEDDDAIENFGLTPEITDIEPLVKVPREEFPLLSSREHVAVLERVADSEQREREETANLVVLKLWLKANKRKWSFEWNGVPISAPISDEMFLARVEGGEEVIAGGDALQVELKYFQDKGLGMYVNDTSTFEVTKVLKVIHRRPLTRLPF